MDILIAEDTEPAYTMLSTVIKFNFPQVNVHWAINGREAIQVFLNSKINFDLVITDLNMPIINGNKLAVMINEHRPTVPIIMWTSAVDEVENPNLFINIINKKIPPVIESIKACILSKDY
jgi:two-component system OmpR family response regulator